MGIPGIYKELGTGERTALSRLAVQHLESTGRPFRLAVDISIWQFQIQVTQGGKSPALRTLYYRLVKLLSLSIQPIFVFDGPYRPSFKRGVRRAPFTSSVDNFLTKQLLKLFGFPFHDAPGEAEAECALLQREGIVDAVMSEDVDTMMFGSTLCLRNWTSEGSRGNKSPTHVDVYWSKRLKETSGLDCDGMMLVALMSGGDYVEAGIANCGIKTSCQAARAGFGKELCSIAKGDDEALQCWRQKVQHEIRTNEGGHFQQKKKAFIIPPDFPDLKVLGYYTHPTVSSKDKLHRLRGSIKWSQEVDVQGLRKFAEEAFGWTFLIGAKHFIRGLAPALLVRKLIGRGTNTATDRETLNTKELSECNIIKSISGRRQHWNTDGEAELRIAYIPNDVVGLELDNEEDIEDGQTPEGIEKEGEAGNSENESGQRSRSPTKRIMTFDPNTVEKVWILETLAKLGAPLLVETWEEDMRNPKKFISRKAREKQQLSALKGGTRRGALDNFVKTSKPGVDSGGQSSNKGNADMAGPPILPRAGVVSAPPSPRKRPLRETQRDRGKKIHQEASTDQGNPDIKGPATREHISHEPFTIPQGVPQAEFRTHRERSKLERSYTIPASKQADTMSQTSPKDDLLQASVTQRSRIRQIRHRKHDLETSPSPPSSPDRSQLCTPTKITKPYPSLNDDVSPAQGRNNVAHPYQLRTPEQTPRRQKAQSTLDHYVSNSCTPTHSASANRRLDFTTPKANRTVERQVHEDFDSDDLPSPSALLTPPPSKHSGPTRKFPEIDHRFLKDDMVAKKTKKLVMVRESLEGAWKTLEPWEFERQKTRQVFQEVEVLDMTAEQ